LRRSRDVTENALATLLGVPAGDFKVQPDRLQQRVQVPTVPAGLPLELLARRPDVVAAEFRVLEAHDLMGQARLAQTTVGESHRQRRDIEPGAVGFIQGVHIRADAEHQSSGAHPGIKAHAGQPRRRSKSPKRTTGAR